MTHMAHEVTRFGTFVSVANKKRKKRSRFLRTFTCALVALFLVLGIIIGEKAGAQSNDYDKLSPDLRDLVINKSQSTVKVVIQFNTSRLSKTLRDLLEKQTLVTNRLKNLNHWVVETRTSMLSKISAFPEVTYVSTDRETKQLGHLSLTTGTDEIRQTLGTNAGGTRLDGAGVGIAVVHRVDGRPLRMGDIRNVEQ